MENGEGRIDAEAKQDQVRCRLLKADVPEGKGARFLDVDDDSLKEAEAPEDMDEEVAEPGLVRPGGPSPPDEIGRGEGHDLPEEKQTEHIPRKNGTYSPAPIDQGRSVFVFPAV